VIDGSEKFAAPYALTSAITVSGDGDGSCNGSVPFVKLSTSLNGCQSGSAILIPDQGLSAFGQAILEEIQEALVNPLDSLEEFVNAHGFAG